MRQARAGPNRSLHAQRKAGVEGSEEPPLRAPRKAHSLKSLCHVAPAGGYREGGAGGVGEVVVAGGVGAADGADARRSKNPEMSTWPARVWASWP